VNIEQIQPVASMGAQMIPDPKKQKQKVKINFFIEKWSQRAQISIIELLEEMDKGRKVSNTCLIVHQSIIMGSTSITAAILFVRPVVSTRRPSGTCNDKYHRDSCRHACQRGNLNSFKLNKILVPVKRNEQNLKKTEIVATNAFHFIHRLCAKEDHDLSFFVRICHNLHVIWTNSHRTTSVAFVDNPRRNLTRTTAQEYRMNFEHWREKKKKKNPPILIPEDGKGVLIDCCTVFRFLVEFVKVVLNDNSIQGLLVQHHNRLEEIICLAMGKNKIKIQIESNTKSKQ
jgi:hypothetical protein